MCVQARARCAYVTWLSPLRREHAMLAKTLGVRILVVAINKMDDPTVAFSQERFDECCEKLSPFLKTCG